MKKNRLLPLVALGLLAAAAPARAQYPTTYCYGSQLWTCFSYQLTATAASGGGTDVSLSIRNLSVAAPSGKASWLSAFALYSPSNIGTGSNMHVTTSGTVGVVNGSQTAASEWDFTSGAQQLGLPGALELVADGQSTNGGYKQGSIQGCGQVSGPTIYFNTCAPTYTGWVVFNFHTSGSWATQTNQFVMGVKWQTTAGSFECTSGAPSQSTPSCTQLNPPTVVPEPFTIALLGTGLVGMGGAGFLKRRKKDDDVA